MPTLQLRRTSLFWFQGAWELGRAFGDELFCFCLFVCLFVCFSTPKVGDYFVFKSHKWVRFSCFCFVFFCFCFCFYLFLWGGFCVFVCVLCCFSFKMFNFPTIYLGSGWYIFFFRRFKVFCFFFSVSPVDKVFCFLLFLLFALLPKIPPPWYQMVRPYPYSVTQMMVDITSSTILNSRAIQWKI